MKSAYDQLRDKFDEDIKLLQASCKHKRTTEVEFWWAIGHSSGTGTLCLRCHKRIDKTQGQNEN
jgi:hypothetical protein